MNYKGRLYGKIAGKYITLAETSEDVDRLRRDYFKLAGGYGDECGPGGLEIAQEQDDLNALLAGIAAQECRCGPDGSEGSIRCLACQARDALLALREAKPEERDTEIRASVAWFAVQMERKLKANDRKGGWSDVPDVYFLQRLHDELAELSDATSGKDPRAIIDEAADVANFAMMIAENASRRGA